MITKQLLGLKQTILFLIDSMVFDKPSLLGSFQCMLFIVGPLFYNPTLQLKQIDFPLYALSI